MKYKMLIILSFLSWATGILWTLWEFSVWILGFQFNPLCLLPFIAGFVFMGIGFKFLDKDNNKSD